MRNDEIGCRDVREQASSAPSTCITMNIGTLLGAMPAKVLLSMRPIVTAGFAKLVDDVNQYAAAM